MGKKTYNEQLLDAVEKSNMEQVESLLSQGADVNYVERVNRRMTGKTALYVATMKKNKKMVRLLLEAGASPCFSPIGHHSARWIAEHLISDRGVMENIIEEHIRHYGLKDKDYNAITPEPKCKAIALIYQSKKFTGRGQEQLQASIQQYDISVWQEALRLAAKLPDKTALQFILQNKKKVINHKNHKGETALMVAAQHGNEEIVQLLLKAGANASIKTKPWFRKGKTALDMAQENNYNQIVLQLKQHLALSPSARSGKSTKHVVSHPSKSANIAQPNKSRGEQLLHAVQNQNINEVKSLFTNGNSVNINHSNDKGDTALLLAVRNQDQKMATLLLRMAKIFKVTSGINHKNHEGDTALLLAVRNNDKDMAQLLLQYGAYTNHEDEKGDTALIVAAKHGHKDIVQLLLGHGADRGYVNEYGDTALIWAAANDHVEIVQVLLTQGAGTINTCRINCQNKRGNTALIVAAAKGHVKIMQALIVAGANINHVNYQGNTALIWAASNGHVNIVRALIQAGANIEQANNVGKTALSCAKNREIRELLVRAYCKTIGDASEGEALRYIHTIRDFHLLQSMGLHLTGNKKNAINSRINALTYSGNVGITDGLPQLASNNNGAALPVASPVQALEVPVARPVQYPEALADPATVPVAQPIISQLLVDPAPLKREEDSTPVAHRVENQEELVSDVISSVLREELIKQGLKEAQGAYDRALRSADIGQTLRRGSSGAVCRTVKTRQHRKALRIPDDEICTEAKAKATLDHEAIKERIERLNSSDLVKKYGGSVLQKAVQEKNSNTVTALLNLGVKLPQRRASSLFVRFRSRKSALEKEIEAQRQLNTIIKDNGLTFTPEEMENARTLIKTTSKKPSEIEAEIVRGAAQRQLNTIIQDNGLTFTPENMKKARTLIENAAIKGKNLLDVKEEIVIYAGLCKFRDDPDLCKLRDNPDLSQSESEADLKQIDSEKKHFMGVLPEYPSAVMSEVLAKKQQFSELPEGTASVVGKPVQIFNSDTFQWAAENEAPIPEILYVEPVAFLDNVPQAEGGLVAREVSSRASASSRRVAMLG